MWSINKAYPVKNLPKRIRKSDGFTVTDLESLSSSELKSLGIVEVDSMPSYNENTQKVSWDSDKWVVSSLSSSELEEKKDKEWIAFREQRNNIIQNFQWRIQKYNSEVRRGVTPTEDIKKIDAYIEELRQIPQKQTDPFNIKWPSDNFGVEDTTE